MDLLFITSFLVFEFLGVETLYEPLAFQLFAASALFSNADHLRIRGLLLRLSHFLWENNTCSECLKLSYTMPFVLNLNASLKGEMLVNDSMDV